MSLSHDLLDIITPHPSLCSFLIKHKRKLTIFFRDAYTACSLRMVLCFGRNVYLWTLGHAAQHPEGKWLASLDIRCSFVIKHAKYITLSNVICNIRTNIIINNCTPPPKKKLN